MKATSDKLDLFGRPIEDQEDLTQHALPPAKTYAPIWLQAYLLKGMESVATSLGCRPTDLFPLAIAFALSHRGEFVKYVKEAANKAQKGS